MVYIRRHTFVHMERLFVHTEVTTIKIKVTDKNIQNLGLILAGQRMLLDDLALQRAERSSEFWNLIRDKYPEVWEKRELRWAYDHRTSTLYNTVDEEEEEKEVYDHD